MKIRTYSGTELNVRPSGQDDGPLLTAFWTHVSRADLTRLHGSATSGAPGAGADPTAGRTETFLAFGGDDQLVAIAMLIADADGGTAKVMVFTDERATYHGVSWALLDHVLAHARAKGIEMVESIFSAEDVRARRVEERMGFVEVAHPGDDGLKILRWTMTKPSPA